MSGLFPNAWHVARREFRMRVSSRTFAVLTAFLAIVGFGLAISPVIFRALGAEEPVEIGVSVQADGLAGDPLALMEATLNGGAAPGAADRFALEPVEDRDAAEDQVRSGALDGLLEISRGSDGDLTFELLSEGRESSPTSFALQQAASSLAIDDRLNRAGIDPADRDQLFLPPDFEVVSTDPDANRDEGIDYASRTVLSTVLVVLIFMAILTYGNWVAGSVAEEKSSRVMELLITAASPQQLLVGKVLGTGAAGLTQYAALLAAAVVGIALQGFIGQSFFGDAVQGGGPLVGATPGMLIAFGLYFLGGFLVYATLYAAAGSLVSRAEDVQQVSTPIITIAMIGYFAAILGGTTSPDAGWVQALTYVPFFSPFLVPLRMAFDTIGPVEVVISLVLLAAGVVLTLWLASRIYAAGVLMYGQRPGLRTLWRATRAAR
jgi:ABC-2 type transport system permease protein